jgi:hypothetical protein
MHWWQHAGSTTGLMLSLSYPPRRTQTTRTSRSLLTRIGPKKSILRFVERMDGPGGGPETPGGLANVVVNNHFDIEFFRLLALNPGMVPQIVTHPLFDCVGHSYNVAYANIVPILATMSIRVFISTLIHGVGWKILRRCDRARRQVITGGRTSTSRRSGRARFAQLQYLYFASGGKLIWGEFRSRGMLKGVYAQAFEQFLGLAELDWPTSIDHPAVALFLPVCDIAINPGAGFPMALRVFATFIEMSTRGFGSSFSAGRLQNSAPISLARSGRTRGPSTPR